VVPEDECLRARAAGSRSSTDLPARAPGDGERFAYGPASGRCASSLGTSATASACSRYRALTFSRFDAVSLPGFDE
jgi:hypothetical protein